MCDIVLGVIAAGFSASLGWLARTCLWRRGLRREQDFFGLPANSEGRAWAPGHVGHTGVVAAVLTCPGCFSPGSVRLA